MIRSKLLHILDAIEESLDDKDGALTSLQSIRNSKVRARVESLINRIHDKYIDKQFVENNINNINNQIERSAVLEPFHYTHDEKDDYCGDEDWLESWDRV